jgi:hypothetical protein
MPAARFLLGSLLAPERGNRTRVEEQDDGVVSKGTLRERKRLTMRIAREGAAQVPEWWRFMSGDEVVRAMVVRGRKGVYLTVFKVRIERLVWTW